MICEICGKSCSDSLMLARHTFCAEGHEAKSDWADSVIQNLRAGLQTSAKSSARLAKAMEDGWKEEEQLFTAIRQSEAATEQEIYKRRLLG